MARVLILDSWCFIEQVLKGKRAAELAALLKAADRLVTVRDVVAETYSFLLRRSKAPEWTAQWLYALRETDIVVLDPRWSVIEEMATAKALKAGLGLVDIALACAARQERARDIVTGDRGFRALGLKPLFAAP